MTASYSENGIYASELYTLGDIIPLQMHINLHELNEQIDQFKEHWVRYNPYKPEIVRYGMSVTSLDGGLSGNPDLTSLREYRKLTGVELSEEDICTPTPVYHACTALHPLLHYFEGFTGRTHYLRLDSGGFFPPHRDAGYDLPARNFRVILPIKNFSVNQFVWLQEDRQINLEPGRPYVINTMKKHSVFSFVNDCRILVMNVTACHETFNRVLRMADPK